MSPSSFPRPFRAGCVAALRVAAVVALALGGNGCQPRINSTGGNVSMPVTAAASGEEANTTAVEEPTGGSSDAGGEVAGTTAAGAASEAIDRDTSGETGETEDAAAVTPEPVARPRLRPLRKLDPDKLEIITFDDLKINMEADQVFEPAMLTDRVRQLDGQRVRIRGFLFPSILQQDGIKEFPLVMNTQCKFGPGGQAHCIILVQLVEGLTTSFTVRPIAVEGRLTLQPWTGPDGNTWSLYHMTGEKVD